MSIYNLLDQLESTIEGSKRAFMQTDKIIVDPEELYKIIDQIRSSVPDDIRDAQWVKREEEQIKRKAQEDYERIIEEARARAQELVSETEVYRLAEIRVREMLEEANQAAHDITSVSYTHLDVYKRQPSGSASSAAIIAS